MVSLPHPDPVSAVRDACRCARQHCACQRGASVHCPVGGRHARGDQNCSLTVHAGRQHPVVVNCKTGCAQSDVIAALIARGVWPSSGEFTPTVTPMRQPTRPLSDGPDALSERKPKPRATELVKTYEYRAADGTLVAYKGRFEGPVDPETGKRVKEFKWRLPHMTEWLGLTDKETGVSLRTVDMPLYNLDLLLEIKDGRIVYFVEGEKAVDACTEAGLLAVCFAGGAASKDFGSALEPLRDRDVVLLPDNDPAGFTYMEYVAAALKPLAKSVRTVRLPVPERGDIVEFLAAGGVEQQIHDALPPLRPVVDHLAFDALRVRIPTPRGTAAFTFTEMEKSARSLDAELEFRIEGKGEPFTQRLNLLSGSQRTELRRDLDSVYGKGDGKDGGWTAVINTAITLARTAFLGQDVSQRLSEIEDPTGDAFLVETMLPDGEATILFGDGSAGKTYVALRLGIAVALGEPFNGMAARQGAVLFVDFENHATRFKMRVKRLLAGLGYTTPPDIPLYYWPAHGRPLVDQADALRRKVAKDGVRLIIVDSAGPACGGKPEDAEIALRYFTAGLARTGVGVTTLTIAHIPKGSDPDKPFGSVFWHNQPRRTWFAKRVQEEESDQIDIGLTCKKVNDGRLPRPFGLRVSFVGEDGPVYVEHTELSEVPELDAGRPLKNRIWDALKRPMTIRELADTLNHDGESVGAILRRFGGVNGSFERVEAVTRMGEASTPVLWQRRDRTSQGREEGV